VSDKELHQAKSLALRDIAMADASLGGIAQRLLSLSMLDLPLDEPARAARLYHDMTAEDVQDAYKKWLRPQDMAQVTEGPPVAP
jgi:zinc protease